MGPVESEKEQTEQAARAELRREARSLLAWLLVLGALFGALGLARVGVEEFGVHPLLTLLLAPPAVGAAALAASAWRRRRVRRQTWPRDITIRRPPPPPFV